MNRAYTDKGDWNSRPGPVPAAGSHAPGELAPPLQSLRTPELYRLFVMAGLDPGTRSGGEPLHSKETRTELLL
jgi:hypothetical protein